ncbi:unnamed protein product [Notodromas monacha]|uniref:Splicing factor 45 n=1 Tax=Notodromas monacha TaxID=399045 RepID=A0A7R9GHU3_9CRUS|nr:unnamed protein product [Notodromas monacha]CAG0921153.1 unnamed protein product [Notodromas monacha]
MSLYDDEDIGTGVSKWSPGGMKLLQSHVQQKNRVNQLTGLASKSKSKQWIAPVVDLNSKDSGSGFPKSGAMFGTSRATKESQSALATASATLLYSDLATPVNEEYDPLRPNDYEKAVKALRARDDERRSEEEKTRDKDRYSDRERRKPRPETDRDREKDRDRERDRDRSKGDRRRTREDSPPMGARNLEGFCRVRGESDDEDDSKSKSRDKPRRDRPGAMIAPPPSLQSEKESNGSAGLNSPASGGSTGLAIAAKIMAKYGYKEGQGLGKHEHGISTALQVEKTSKRGGRIIHENQLMPPPPVPGVAPDNEIAANLMPPPPPPGVMPPPPPPGGPPPGAVAAAPAAEEKPEDENNITEIMKKPSKVVLLKNMVGPGEVDDFLETEVKDECTQKYGDVIKVIIFEIPNQIPEEAVRIFVEFRRMESAIKAVVDLNGRFFGGRTVKAGFYEQTRFCALQLGD